MKYWILLMTGVAALLLGCAGAPVHHVSPPATSQETALVSCRDFFIRFDGLIRQAGVADAQAATVEGYPYLRTTRFLSSYRETLLNDKEFRFWLHRMEMLAREGRAIEWANLSSEQRKSARSLLPAGGDRKIDTKIDQCAKLMQIQDLKTPADRLSLQQQVQSSDDYRTAQRAIGLYPLTLLPVAYGINRWHQRTLRTFETETSLLPVRGELIRYAPASGIGFEQDLQIEALLKASSGNPFQMPLPDADQLARLFATFAPIWEIDTVSGSDLIGAPVWTPQKDSAMVDSEQPTLYRHASYTRFEGRPMLQLNYIIWFPSRPCSSEWDILCGELDGITWRVTLSSEGKPLLYDSMHNCGCYHQFFPTSGVRPKTRVQTLDEQAFIPSSAPGLQAGQRLVLRIAPTSHHIESIYADSRDQGLRQLEWRNYSELRSLPWPEGGRRSLFRPDTGLVSGTERGERWILWPMGVPSAGAMRQWGHHATAFVGRRHFDDPYLMQEAFASVRKPDSQE